MPTADSFPSEEISCVECFDCTFLCEAPNLLCQGCCYRKCVCDGVLRVGIFLLCTPLYPPPAKYYVIWWLIYDTALYTPSQNRHTLSEYGRKMHYC